MDEDHRESGMNGKPEGTEPAPVGTPYAVEPTPDAYPLRDRSEDPRWAVWIVWIWVIIAIALFSFFIALAILGFWYD